MTMMGSTLYKNLKGPSVFPSTTKHSNNNTKLNFPNIGTKKVYGNMERYFSPKNQKRVMETSFGMDKDEIVADGKKMEIT